MYVVEVAVLVQWRFMRTELEGCALLLCIILECLLQFDNLFIGVFRFLFVYSSKFVHLLPFMTIFYITLKNHVIHSFCFACKIKLHFVLLFIKNY
jgi:hypothetical protein